MNENLPLEPRAQRSDEEKLRDFQRKLYTKAKQEVNFRFYSLYDKLYLPYVVREAYRRCRRKNGKPGVDGKTFEQIEKEGVEGFLAEIGKKLKERTYKPNMVRRVYIPKANGKMRALRIGLSLAPSGVEGKPARIGNGFRGYGISSSALSVRCYRITRVSL